MPIRTTQKARSSLVKSRLERTSRGLILIFPCHHHLCHASTTVAECRMPGKQKKTDNIAASFYRNHLGIAHLAISKVLFNINRTQLFEIKTLLRVTCESGLWSLIHNNPIHSFPKQNCFFLMTRKVCATDFSPICNSFLYTVMPKCTRPLFCQV